MYFLEIDSFFDARALLLNLGWATILLVLLAIVFFEVRDWLGPRLARGLRAFRRGPREPLLYDGFGRLIDPDRMSDFSYGTAAQIGERQSALDRHVRRAPRRLVNSVTGSSLHPPP